MPFVGALTLLTSSSPTSKPSNSTASDPATFSNNTSVPIPNTSPLSLSHRLIFTLFPLMALSPFSTMPLVNLYQPMSPNKTLWHVSDSTMIQLHGSFPSSLQLSRKKSFNSISSVSKPNTIQLTMAISKTVSPKDSICTFVLRELILNTESVSWIKPKRKPSFSPVFSRLSKTCSSQENETY